MTSLIETRTAEIEAKVANLRAEIEADPISLEESQAAAERNAKLIDQIDDVSKMSETELADFRAEFQETAKIADKANKVYQMRGYQQTLDAVLVEINTAYCISSEPSLVSPAGFHPDDRVFVQPHICIHTDLDPRLPENNHLIPSANVTLYCNVIERGA